MMTNKMENNSYIKREKLDEINYTISLIDEAIRLNVIDEKVVLDFQLQLVDLLKVKTDKYNSCMSSSISVDKAKNIMESNIYTIGLYLKEFIPDDAVNILKNEGIINVYDKGRKLIDRKIMISKVLYKKVLNNFIQTKNETYNLTIIKGIKSFFKIYDSDYNAQDMKITADYPTYISLFGRKQGIEFIEKYLEYLYYENEFCKMFEIEDIKNLLFKYSEDYEDLIINIFQIVLMQVIGCVLIKDDYRHLKINHDELQDIYELFKGKNKEEIYSLIFSAYLKIDIKNESLKKYIENGLKEIQSEIYNRYKIHALDKVFII